MAGMISGNGTQNLNKLFVPEINHIPSKHKETKFFFIRKIPFKIFLCLRYPTIIINYNNKYLTSLKFWNQAKKPTPNISSFIALLVLEHGTTSIRSHTPIFLESWIFFRASFCVHMKSLNISTRITWKTLWNLQMSCYKTGSIHWQFQLFLSLIHNPLTSNIWF